LLKLNNNQDNTVSGILGLGNVRSLEDFYSFTKIDIKNKKVYSNFCRENNMATEQEVKDSDKTLPIFILRKYSYLFFVFIIIIFIILFWCVKKKYIKLH